MATHNLKQLKYDNQDIIAEVAVRDQQGRIINNTYVDNKNDQIIDGQKDFIETPRVLVRGIGGEDHYLPDGYNELNYIFIPGGETGANKCYFDTGIQPDHTLEFELKYTYENVGPGVASGQGVVLGARVSSTSWVCTLSGFNTHPTGYFGFNNNIRNQAYLTHGENIVSFRFKNGDTSKGIYTSINSNGTNTYEISRASGYPSNMPTLFAGALHDGTNSTENLNGRLYYIKIWKNNTQVREFYPCEYSRMYGLFDKISNTFFAPIAGTPQPGEYVKDVYQNLITNGNFANVAFTGNYSDLVNKPTIPTVYNNTLTIQKNGTTVQTFTANSNTNKTADIIVPTKLSDLTQDIALGNVDDVQVNGISVVTNKVAEVIVPTKTSDITNDNGYITSDDLPEGEINLTLTETSISDGTTTFELVANPSDTSSTALSKLKFGGTTYSLVTSDEVDAKIAAAVAIVLNTDV